MRRIISFIFASAILGGGLYLLYLQFFHSDIVFFKLVIGAGIAIVIGGGWLMADFVLPALGRKDDD